jgi:hypothetical protein
VLIVVLNFNPHHQTVGDALLNVLTMSTAILAFAGVGWDPDHSVWVPTSSRRQRAQQTRSNLQLGTPLPKN